MKKVLAATVVSVALSGCVSIEGPCNISSVEAACSKGGSMVVIGAGLPEFVTPRYFGDAEALLDEEPEGE